MSAAPHPSPARISGTDRALRYVSAVLSGERSAGRFVHAACARFENDLMRAPSPEFPYRYDATKADREIRFVELLPHAKGKWAAKKSLLVLEDWQCFIEANLFGWVHHETGMRRFRLSYESMPRKSGKSSRLAARGLYMLLADGETGSEVYCGAGTEKQAHEVFSCAWQMVRMSPKLADRLGVSQAGSANAPGNIYVVRDMSRMRTMIGKPRDGASPHMAIIDEYHEHETDHMVDTMMTGMGAREQPLLSIITTAGVAASGPCREKERDIERILTGDVIDETQFGVIYGLDPGDAWDDEQSLVKANPNYGVSVFADFLRNQLAEARRSATKQSAFRTKHLNEWVGARVAWMNMLAWHKQKKAFGLADMTGAKCWMACDLASKKDIAALTLLFEQGDAHYVISKFYAPESALETQERYRGFSLSGHLTITPGNMIDYAWIEKDIIELSKKVVLQDIAFDDWQANYLMTRLQAARIPVISFNQTVKNLSEPMKEVEARVLSGRLWHDGNPVLTWMIGNVVAKQDAKDNVYPRKENDNDPHCKIDGAVSLIVATGRAIAAPVAAKQFQMLVL